MSKEIPLEHQMNIFNENNVRCIINDNNCWFVIVDVISALTGSNNPENYIKDMKRRLPGFKKG